MKIGCDIGGVVKEMTSEHAVEGALHSIRQLQSEGHQIVFISKCKHSFQVQLTEWLCAHHLQHYPVFFCNEYSEKQQIATATNIDVMIDDKLQVFANMPPNVHKIWLCNDMQKIKGARKFQSTEVSSVHICANWNEVVSYINKMHT